MIKHLQQDTFTKKQIKIIESLDSFSATRRIDLEKANNLLFDFYYANNMMAVEEMLKVMTTIKFNGNFNLWSFIEPSYCLKYLISSNKKDKKEITDMFYNDIKSSLDTEEEHLVFLFEIQNGCRLKPAHEKLMKNIDNGNNEYIWRSNLVRKYLQILALGAKGSISSEGILLEINNNTEKLRKIYKIINKSD